MYFVRFVLFCTDTVNDFLRKNCPYIAAAISFYTLFSFFPLVLAIISISGLIVGQGDHQARLARQIADIIPVSREFVRETLEGVARARTFTGVASILGLLWASTAAFGALRKGLNAAWGITKTRRFLKERVMDFSLVLGTGLLLVVLLFVSPVLAFFGQITHYLASESGISSELFSGMAAHVIGGVVSFLTFVMLYRFLPNTRVRFSDVWLGALGAAAAFEGAKWGFVWYLKQFPVYNVVYGSVGAIMALLTWVYVSAIIVLFGALVTSRYAAYAASVRDAQGFNFLWTGLSRVRLRTVVYTKAG